MNLPEETPLSLKFSSLIGKIDEDDSKFLMNLNRTGFDSLSALIEHIQTKINELQIEDDEINSGTIHKISTLFRKGADILDEFAAVWERLEEIEVKYEVEF